MYIHIDNYIYTYTYVYTIFSQIRCPEASGAGTPCLEGTTESHIDYHECIMLLLSLLI